MKTRRDETDLLYDFILMNEVATEEEISLVTCINGYNTEAMMDIIWARCALRSIEQCQSEGMYCEDDLLEYYGLLPEDEDDEDEENE